MEISLVGFYFNIHRKDNKVFVTSLYKIDYIIKEKKETLEEDEAMAKEIYQRLLVVYTLYTNIFSKAASNQLLLYRLYDYKI